MAETMSFLLKATNFLKDFLTPIGATWAFLLLLLVWLIRRKRWLEAAPVFFAAGLLWILGATPLAPKLLQSLEKPFYGVNLTNLTSADAVIMLGGTLEPSPSDPRQINLTRAADRIMAAVDLMRLHKANALVLGGGAARVGDKDTRDSELIQNLLNRWSLVEQPIHSLDGCLNTRDEALKTKELAKQFGWKKFWLVSSANHLERALATFRKAGMDVQGVGCDFDAESSQLGGWRFEWVPKNRNLECFDAWLHETLGTLYYRVRGWI